MLIDKKLIVALGLSSVIALVAFTSMPPPDAPGFKNLKVLPKHITSPQLNKIMSEWERSLGVGCSFCHSRDETTRKTDYASDAKPEKLKARQMFKMMNKFNKNYFDAKKDSIGMIMQTGINCNSCHNGVSHPIVTVPERRRRQAAPAAAPGTPPQEIKNQ